MAFFHKGRLIKSVSLFGFGKSNRAIFEYLKKNYHDLKISVRLYADADNLPDGVKVFKGENLFRDFSEDISFISPSIRRDKAEFCGKLLSSDAELFFEKNTRDVFAVTGSDGKSTTTTLAKMLLGADAFAVGNIGVPFTKALSYPESAPIAAELSSFQLMDFKPKSKRAVITNITPNHLDWHSSMDEYVAAKENIFKNTHEPVFFIDRTFQKELLKKYPPFAVASYEFPESELKKYGAQTCVYVDRGAIYANSEKLLEISDIFRNEDYNIKNLLTAIALCYGYYDNEALTEVAKSFKGLAHRFELLFELDGVKFFNSSIDSSPQRTLSTLALRASHFVLLMGGRTKMNNFEILIEVINKNAHALVLTGENRHEIYNALKSVSAPIYVEEDFESAVKLAFDLAKSNCDLIFSPASVSFDAFENFEKRGEAFRAALEKIKTRT